MDKYQNSFFCYIYIMKTQSSIDPKAYDARIRKAQNFLEAHLNQVPTLETLASIAGVSAFHFHRLFHAYVGEPVAAHIKRLRLERATTHLNTTERRIIDIAMDAGFESEAAFSKAFKAHFQQPPSAYRKGQHPLTKQHPQTNRPMSTTNITPKDLLEIDPIPVYYVRKTGPYAEAAHAAFSTLMPFLYGNRLMKPQSRCFGISWDDPKVTDASQLRYDAATTIDVEHPLKGDVERKDIPGGRYATFLHKGPYENFTQTYDAIFSNWLPQSGETLRDEPPFEEYLNRDPRRTKPENLRTLIYIPLA